MAAATVMVNWVEVIELTQNLCCGSDRGVSRIRAGTAATPLASTNYRASCWRAAAHSAWACCPGDVVRYADTACSADMPGFAAMALLRIVA